MLSNIVTRRNRAQRRRAAKLAQRQSGTIDRGTLIRILDELAASDPTINGATLISPDGEVQYIDANLLRRGGGRA